MTDRAYMLPSKSVDYETPADLFDQLDAAFGPFTLDPCGQSYHRTAVACREHGGHNYDGTSEKMDGLLQPWDGRVFMNPPYGRGIAEWIQKAVEEVYVKERVEIVVALLPVRTDTAWWQGYINRGSGLTEQLGLKLIRIALVNRNIKPHYATASGVGYLPGRLKFGGEKNSAPFPSAVVVWSRYDD